MEWKIIHIRFLTKLNGVENDEYDSCVDTWALTSISRWCWPFSLFSRVCHCWRQCRFKLLGWWERRVCTVCGVFKYRHWCLNIIIIDVNCCWWHIGFSCQVPDAFGDFFMKKEDFQCRKICYVDSEYLLDFFHALQWVLFLDPNSKSVQGFFTSMLIFCVPLRKAHGDLFDTFSIEFVCFVSIWCFCTVMWLGSFGF